jgi:hypothetical protein
LYISAGVGTEESFTWDFLTLAGLPPPFEAWAFDGTVAAFPPQYIPKGWRVYFVRRNIDPEMTAYTANLHRLIAAHSNIFLKMDIEGSEYAWLAGLTDEQMGRFCQIVVEFHDINGAGGGGTKELFTAVWEKVQRTHWVAHIHGNNYGGTGDDGRPNVIEVTFVRQDVRAGMFVAEKDIVIAPIAGLDWPNRCGWPDIAWQPLRSLSKARQLTSDDV